MASTNQTLTLVSTYQSSCEIVIMYMGDDGEIYAPTVQLAPNQATILTVTNASDTPYPQAGTSFTASTKNLNGTDNESHYSGNWGDVVFAVNDSGVPFPNTIGCTPGAETYPNW